MANFTAKSTPCIHPSVVEFTCFYYFVRSLVPFKGLPKGKKCMFLCTPYRTIVHVMLPLVMPGQWEVVVPSQACPGCFRQIMLRPDRAVI